MTRDPRLHPHLDNDKVWADYNRYEAAAKAYIDSSRAATKRDNTPHTWYGELETDTHAKGKVYVTLRKEIIAVEMKDATDRGKPKDEETIRREVELRIYDRAVRMLLKDEFDKENGKGK